MTSLDSPVTNHDLAEALKAVTSGMNKVIDEMRSGFETMNKRFNEMDRRFNKVDGRFDKMDDRFDKVVDDIHDLKTSSSNMPSKTEFNKLKSKVDKFLVD